MNNTQMSDSFIVGSFLAITGGYMDAYTYLARDHVFAHAQTGNMLLFGVNLFEGNIKTAFEYLLPIMSFVLGVFVAEMVRIHFSKQTKIHWRQIPVAIQIVFLVAVGFIKPNLLANSLVCVSCGMQLQTFRTVNGHTLATTMLIGNTRTATDALCNYLHNKDNALLHKSLLYYTIIVLFIVGALLGNVGVKLLGEKAIIVSGVILIFVFVLLFNSPKHHVSNAP